jgi:hypothetical protein
VGPPHRTALEAGGVLHPDQEIPRADLADGRRGDPRAASAARRDDGLVLAYGDLRPEEMLALVWADVRPEVLIVERALAHGELRGDDRRKRHNRVVHEGRTVVDVAAQAAHTAESCLRQYARLFRDAPTERVPAEVAIRKAREAARDRTGGGENAPVEWRGELGCRPLREMPARGEALYRTRTGDPFLTMAVHSTCGAPVTEPKSLHLSRAKRGRRTASGRAVRHAAVPPGYLRGRHLDESRRRPRRWRLKA